MILCRFGLHNYTWNEVQSEKWVTSYNRGMSFYDPDKDRFAYTRQYVLGTCRDCGYVKKKFLEKV